MRANSDFRSGENRMRKNRKLLRLAQAENCRGRNMDPAGEKSQPCVKFLLSRQFHKSLLHHKLQLFGG
jgi:hypothetical protein